MKIFEILQNPYYSMVYNLRVIFKHPLAISGFCESSFG